MVAEAQGPDSHAGAHRASSHRNRFSTRRRLIAAFSTVLAAFVASLSLPLIGLHRMEATFVEMEEHERQERLALQLEDAVRVQYSAEGDFVKSDGAGRAAYDAARSRVEVLTAALRARVDEPEVVTWMNEIAEASARLDEAFRGAIAPAVERGHPSAGLVHDQSHALVFFIDAAVDRLLMRLHRATSTFRQDLHDLESAVWKWTIAFLVAMPGLVAGAVLYLSRSVAHPLARLSEGASAIARGDLEARIDIRTPDEFGAMAAEFNAMTVALRQHQQKLVESEKLAGIGRLAAGIAHELNNPLQVMLGYLTLDRNVPDARLAQHLAAVESEARRCKQIVDGLLELARPPATAAAIDLRVLCEDVTEGLLRSTSSTARVTVEGAASAMGNSLKLRQILFNLVKNAIEAAGPDGAVQVAIRGSGDHAEVAVTDSGPGVPKEARARLFEPFFTTKASGTGLGLAISRAIALAHGGDIRIENGDVGGAVFTLRLPRAPAEVR
ncbi:MAG TPA: HAMP domain-containing sensor histidine kinase [Anaeromyxobacter sp.]|nr:HAMP domain-containing sensor histidine kinase [Anaeromyxobacter sp.]